MTIIFGAPRLRASEGVLLSVRRWGELLKPRVWITPDTLVLFLRSLVVLRADIASSSQAEDTYPYERCCRGYTSRDRSGLESRLPTHKAVRTPQWGVWCSF